MLRDDIENNPCPCAVLFKTKEGQENGKIVKWGLACKRANNYTVIFTKTNWQVMEKEGRGTRTIFFSLPTILEAEGSFPYFSSTFPKIL